MQETTTFKDMYEKLFFPFFLPSDDL